MRVSGRQAAQVGPRAALLRRDRADDGALLVKLVELLGGLEQVVVERVGVELRLETDHAHLEAHAQTHRRRKKRAKKMGKTNIQATFKKYTFHENAIIENNCSRRETRRARARAAARAPSLSARFD